MTAPIQKTQIDTLWGVAELCDELPDEPIVHIDGVVNHSLDSRHLMLGYRTRLRSGTPWFLTWLTWWNWQGKACTQEQFDWATVLLTARAERYTFQGEKHE